MLDKLPPRILILELIKSSNISLFNIVERSWFNIAKVNTLEKAIAYSHSSPPDIIIIDSIQQDDSTMESAITLRTISGLEKIPIIFLVNSKEVTTNSSLIDNEFVDTLVKPFTSDQLITSIRTLLRRSNWVLKNKVITYKEISVDLTTYQVTKNGQEIHLGPTEFKILQLLLQSPKTTFSRQDIIDKVWPVSKNIDARTVDVHINRIRNSIKHKNSQVFIKTVRSLGYCIDSLSS